MTPQRFQRAVLSGSDWFGMTPADGELGNIRNRWGPAQRLEATDEALVDVQLVSPTDCFYDLHHAETRGFVGLPTTVAGLVWSSAFLGRPAAIQSAALLVGCALAMVSAVPIPRPRGLGLLAFGGWAAVLVILHATGARFH